MKYVNKTFISCSNKYVLLVYLQEHVMYEHYSSDYESVGRVYLRGSLYGSHFIVDYHLLCYHIDRTTTVMDR